MTSGLEIDRIVLHAAACSAVNEAVYLPANGVVLADTYSTVVVLASPAADGDLRRASRPAQSTEHMTSCSTRFIATCRNSQNATYGIVPPHGTRR